MRQASLAIPQLMSKLTIIILCFVKYECSADGVTIYVRGVAFKCSCEGEEVTSHNIAIDHLLLFLFHPQHIVDVSSDSDCVLGSIICPSCASICYDQPGNCPTTGMESTHAIHYK